MTTLRPSAWLFARSLAATERRYPRRAVTDRGPGKPVADQMFGLHPQAFAVQAHRRRVAFSDENAVRGEQLAGAAQQLDRVAADADVAVGQ